jgi:hypothetical protein
MKDFKTMPKMACGGMVKKYSGEEGSYVTGARGENALPKIQAQSREMQEKGVPVNPTPEQMNAARMTRVKDAFSKKPFGPGATPKRTGGSVKRKK